MRIDARVIGNLGMNHQFMCYARIPTLTRRTDLSDSRFALQRHWFKEFKAYIDQSSDLKSEVELAFEMLLGEYDTAVYENRFVVGGVCEYIIGAAFRAAGIDALNTGALNTRIDIQLPDCEGYSVKGSFTHGYGDIRLINSLGSADDLEWIEATIFIFSGLRLGYCDPELLPVATRSTKDALVLSRRRLDEFLKQQHEYLIPLDIPYKSDNPSETKVASQAVAREIMTRPGFKILASHI